MTIRLPHASPLLGFLQSFEADGLAMTEPSVLVPAFNERAPVPAESAISAVLDADLGVDGIELLVGADDSIEARCGVLARIAWSDNVRILVRARPRLYNSFITNVMTCRKAMQTDLFRSLGLSERGFAVAGNSRRSCCAQACGFTRFR